MPQVWILQGKTFKYWGSEKTVPDVSEIKQFHKKKMQLWVVYITCVRACLVMSWLFATPWTIACQVLLYMEVPRQEHWSRLPFPSPEDLPYPGFESTSLASPAWAGGFFTTPLRKSHTLHAKKSKEILTREMGIHIALNKELESGI